MVILHLFYSITKLLNLYTTQIKCFDAYFYTMNNGTRRSPKGVRLAPALLKPLWRLCPSLNFYQIWYIFSQGVAKGCCGISASCRADLQETRLLIRRSDPHTATAH